MRASWDRWGMAAVAVGGAAGASARWGVISATQPSTGVPWTVLALNVAGSFLLGVLVALELTHPRARRLVHEAGAIGFCGGLTTFSTFTVELVVLVRDDRAGPAAIYGVLSVGLSLAAVLAGAGLQRRVRALSLPLEEQP